MATKQAKNNNFKEVLVAKIDDYMDEAFATDDPGKKQKYREVIREMEQLLLMVCELEQILVLSVSSNATNWYSVNFS